MKSMTPVYVNPFATNWVLNSLIFENVCISDESAFDMFTECVVHDK